MINALITTFPGLPSLSIPLLPGSSILTLHASIATRLALPSTLSLRLLTTSGHELTPTSTHPISTLLDGSTTTLLPLALLPALPGGKGGFGSQLRAAGGRMSSRKKRGQEENSDSCRNLDGRRIRTVKEAKALAAYLEIKPEMDRAEREKRKERWRKVVEQANRREAEERGDPVLGMGGARFEDTEWLEKTEEEKERLREAVVQAMRAGAYEDGAGDKKMRDASPGSSGSSSGADEEVEQQLKKSRIAVPKPPSPPVLTKAKPIKFAGFDDDDEFMSGDDEEMDDIAEEDEEEEEEPIDVKGKGKAKVKAA